MKNLLYLVHRLPYPPNKGDKIRSYNLLRHLATHYHVHLGTFIDDPADNSNIEPLHELCADIMIDRIHPRLARLRSLTGLLTGQPLSLPYYRSNKLQNWIDDKLNSGSIDAVFIFSGVMAQFVTRPTVPSVADLVDVDSEKFRAYGGESRWPMSWIYRREADLLLQHERDVARHYDHTLFVTDAEAQLFRKLAPESAGRVDFRANGVDTEFFDPARPSDSPYTTDNPSLVFVGAMDYRPNIDAVVWFADKVLPKIHEQMATVDFWIVGMNPSSDVMKLSERPGIQVTGAVDDVRPYVAHASIVVAPLRIARGVQNKVLEAMAMGRPIVATRAAMEGIEFCDGYSPVITEDAADMAQAVISELRHPEQNGNRARGCILKNYGWESSLSDLYTLLLKPQEPD